ncbi:MAG: hypothetical protein JO057_25120, partial [Chloroflexi bacterium]|nr:hypothetical protein [Chloroflexota bacterium]
MAPPSELPPERADSDGLVGAGAGTATVTTTNGHDAGLGPVPAPRGQAGLLADSPAGDRPWAGSWRRREPWLALLVLAAVMFVYAWSGHFWVDVVDEGYFLDLSQRVLNGALPYRDFTTYYTPGTFYLFAAAFKLFGTNLLVIRYLMVVVRGLCALLLYVLARRVAPWPLAWLPFALM